MRKRAFPFCLFFLILGGMLGPFSLKAAEYRYDEDGSRVSFALTHLRIITVSGHFKTFSGFFRFDPGKIENSAVDIRIETGSVESGSKMRDRDLRSKNFFWSGKHPEIIFSSTMAKQKNDREFDVYGNLTIRGISRPVVFVTEWLSDPASAKAGLPLRFRSHTYIKRKDFRLGTGNWLDPILFVTDETLTISLEIEGRPVKGAEGS